MDGDWTDLSSSEKEGKSEDGGVQFVLRQRQEVGRYHGEIIGVRLCPVKI